MAGGLRQIVGNIYLFLIIFFSVTERRGSYSVLVGTLSLLGGRQSPFFQSNGLDPRTMWRIRVRGPIGLLPRTPARKGFYGSAEGSFHSSGDGRTREITLAQLRESLSLLYVKNLNTAL